MSIRTQTFAIIALTLVCAAVFIIIFAQVILLNGFQSSDKPEMLAVVHQVRDTLAVFIIAVLLIAALSGLWFAALLNRFILSRITQLKRDIDTIRGENRVTDRVCVRGKDELTALGNALNDLLGSLETVQGELTHARDEALEALESKNQLLANISHDARTPLTVIMLRAENMERGMYGTITPRQHEVLSGIRASANQMHFFVNNLLASAKLKTGMMQLLSEPMDVKQIMKDIETLMEPLASESGIKLFVEMSADEGFTPFGDAERIKQILFNLIDNAIKFTDAGGSIRLRVVSETYRRWAISIQDTGQGIPQDELQHIFRAFYQVTQSTATKATAAGVGLGLSIVQQLTSLMEGTIEIESKVGIGTTFTIRLPTRAPKVDTREMMAIGEAAARPDVLIVQNQP